MNAFSTLRTRTLVFLIGMIFSFSLAGQATAVALTNNNNPQCLTQTISIFILLQNANIVFDNVIDNNMGDNITAVGDCTSCNGPFGWYELEVTLTNGTIGSTETFFVSLVDLVSFNDNTGQGMIIGPSISFNLSVVVNATPTITISPSTLELCDGENSNLSAIVTNNAFAINSYTWAADGGNSSFQNGLNPGSSSAASVIAADTYRVTVSNSCGDGTANLSTTTNNTPSIQMDCTHNGNMTTTITADILNTTSGVTVQFFNDGNLHTTSTNNNGPNGDPSITVDDATFHQQVFTVSASNSCGNASVSGSCLVLPVELLYFRAEPLDNNTLLEWATATELNNDFFTIERSFDGRDFSPIGIIQGAGNSQEVLKYEYVDKEGTSIARESSIYYRLKQTDFDGHFTYSEVVVLDIDPRHSFDILYQNFQEESLKAVINNPGAEPLDVRLYDLNGHQIRQVNLLASQGRTELSLSVPNLKVGFYILTASNGQQTVSKKVAKVE